MSKQQNIEVYGEVTQELGNATFRVHLDTYETDILCTISGKIRKNYIRIINGDRVKVEMSPYDMTRGRIVLRLKGEDLSQEDESSTKNNKKINGK